MGFFLVADFVCNYFVDSFFAGMVVDIFASNAYVAIENHLSLVDWMGF